MKIFFVGLALGFGIGFLLLPKSGNEHEELQREKTRELQRNLPQHTERALQSAAIQERDRFSLPRRPEYESRGGAIRTGIHPIAVLNMATEKELVAAGVDPAQASKIISHRPYTSLQDAMDRGLLSLGALAEIQKGAAAHELVPLQPLA
ncbi:MAG TPA: hypothetical protein VL177_18975 [Terriglobales bacterium]|jgi:hypothetical protein|nr:hypothetical protein [Terriglobales bacterium]